MASVKQFLPGGRVAIPWGFTDAAPLEGIATLVAPDASKPRPDGLVPWLVRFGKEDAAVRRFIRREWLL